MFTVAKFAAIFIQWPWRYSGDTLLYIYARGVYIHNITQFTFVFCRLANGGTYFILKYAIVTIYHSDKRKGVSDLR